jgi:hypothetical protein
VIKFFRDLRIGGRLSNWWGKQRIIPIAVGVALGIVLAVHVVGTYL